MATRHLAEAAPRIALLERIIEDLQSAGRDASTASSMLRTFVGLRDAMEDHLASLQRYPRGQAGGASSTSYAPKAACPHHLILLDMAMMLTGGDKGTMQLVDEASGQLTIVAHRGFNVPFLEFASRVHHGTQSACGLALSAADVNCTDMADENCTLRQAIGSGKDQGAGDAREGAKGAVTSLSGAGPEQG